MRSQNAALENTRKELAVIKIAADEVSVFAEDIINTVREPLIVLDQDLRVVKVSSSFYDFFKVIPEKTVGQLIYDLGDKQWDIPKLRELLEAILPEQATFDNYEVEHDFIGIGRRTMLLNARQIPRVLGKERIILLAIEDITERKRLEDLLNEAEARYRHVFNTASDGIVLFEKSEGKITHANQAVETMLGYSVEESVGKKLQDIGIVDIDDFQTLMQILDEIGITNYTNVPIKTKSGQHIDVDIYLADRAKLVQCNIRDISQRKQAEEKLAHLSQNNELILRSAAEGILGLDLQDNHTFINPAAAKMLGYEAEELLGHSGHSTWHHTKPDGSPYPVEECPIHSAYREGVVHRESKEVFWRKDGTSFAVEYASTPIHENGQPVGAVVTFTDITDRKREEEEKRSLEKHLQRSEKMEALGQLAGKVAHDLNNVLGVLIGYSELLLMEIPVENKARGFVEIIMQYAEKGAAIIQDLLTLARREVAISDVINLNNVVSDFLKTPVLENMKNLHPQVTFRTEFDEGLLNIKGSALHLEKTVMNLVANAAEAISGVGEVAIRTENRYLDKPLRGYDEIREGDYIVLTVSDTGNGIPAENIEKIFEPFFTEKTMGRSGTGLGLAIVWGAVKDHNGYIDVQSQVDEGTTFTLYFPVTREEPAAQKQQVPIESYLGKGEAVLVVDDIAEQRDIAARLLAKLGYHVHVVASGEEAVEYLRGNNADILVLDMIMAPGIDGLETYQRILEINPNQKAIIVSGFSANARVKEAQKLGAGAYVKKPYILEKIGVAIRDELNR